MAQTQQILIALLFRVIRPWLIRVIKIGPVQEHRVAYQVSTEVLRQWLRAWLALEANSQELANALTRSSFDQIVELEGGQEIDHREIDVALTAWRSRQQMSDNGLLALLALCLRSESAYRSAGIQAEAPVVVGDDSDEYALMPMPEALFRALTGADGLRHEFDRIPSSSVVLGLRRSTGLEMRWVKISGGIKINSLPMQDLYWELPEDGRVRFGVASWVRYSEFEWKLDREGHVVKDRTEHFIRCLGCTDDELFPDLRERLAAVVEAALEEGINVLVLPELTIEKRLLDVLSEQLYRAKRTQRGALKLVIAGSSHHELGDGNYTNRSVALSGWGRALWVQDKLVPFVIRRDGTHYREPTQVGTVLQMRESRTLGRVAIAICSDLCIAEAFAVKAMCDSMVSLCLVPSMQADGNTARLEDAARALQASHWGSSVVSNVLVSEARDGAEGAVRPSDFARVADSVVNQASAASQFTSVLRLYDFYRISSQQLVNYKLDE